MLRLPALLLFLVAVTALHASAQEFVIPSVTVSGGDLPYAVALAPADADAFRRRVNQPPRLDDPPSVAGTPYVVTSPYWPDAVRLEEDEDVSGVSTRGDYYPDGGYVRVTLDEDDVWLVLSLRQRAILDRYIRLTKGSVLGEAPPTLAVLAAAAETEAFGVQAGNQVVAPDTAVQLMSALAAANPAPFVEPREPPIADRDGFWLVVTLPEGRALRYYYDGSTLTEALGTERYDAAPVRDLLAAIAPASLPGIEQEQPAGSLLWWPVMLGGGTVAIGAAVWLRRVVRSQ